jgi:maltose alpha-D-glucosyltransferase/alpha-amylase
MPNDPAETTMLVDFYRLERCIYEVGYDLDNRPDWLEIPIRGLLELIETSSRGPSAHAPA